MNLWLKSIPEPAASDPVKWAVENRIQVDGHSFDPELCPQSVKPMRAMSLADKDCKIGTYIKPVQSGGSTAGEVILAYWAKYAYGLIQSNWQDDIKSKERWKDRDLPCLESAPLDWSGGRDSLVCEARFSKSIIRSQGVFNENALNSETVPYQRNEEVHLWKPGHLAMARDRQTRIWNSKALDISNAARIGSQLHISFEEGTMEEWETICPVCGIKHAMHFRWNPRKPELGGLRWDASTRLSDGRPNYNKLAETIRYQFPCGHEIKSNAASRRTLRGDYSEPKNAGAHKSHRSWISEAVSYDQISWLDLIKEWHSAIRALKSGDTEPMFRFVTRRECRFYSDQSLPYSGETIYNSAMTKNRTGMKDAIMRTALFDWQAGYKHLGQLEHYWGIIMDVDINANSQLVWEGKVESDSELIAELDAHEVPRVNAWLDCTGTQMKRHLQFCYQNGMNGMSLALSKQSGFLHADRVRRFYSEGKPIYKQLNTTPMFEPSRQRNMKTGEVTELPNPEEPIVVELYKAGMLANYFFIRNMKMAVLAQNPKATDKDYIRIDIPGDVSEEFKQMLESWEVVPGHRANRKDESVDGFKPRSGFDHQLMNMAYHCFVLDWKLHPEKDVSLLGARLAELGLSERKIEA